MASLASLSPIRPRLVPSASEMQGTRPKGPRLFADEEGGVEPVENPRMDALASRFGLSHAPLTPATQAGDAAARAGVLSRGYDFNQLSDPGADRRASENAIITEQNAMTGGNVPMQTPTSRESQLEREYLQTQVGPEERRGIKREADVAGVQAADLAYSNAQAAMQRQAAIQAWEETYQMPYSEEARKDIAETVRKNDEDAGLMADLGDMRTDMEAEIDERRKLYPGADRVVDPTLDPQGSTYVTNQAKALKREEDAIRQKYMLQMNQLLTVRTRRAIEMGKKGQPDPVSASDLDEFGLPRK